jgi:hypothetical protein
MVNVVERRSLYSKESSRLGLGWMKWQACPFAQGEGEGEGWKKKASPPTSFFGPGQAP